MPLTIKQGATRPALNIPLTERPTPNSKLRLLDLSDVTDIVAILNGKDTETKVERPATVETVNGAEIVVDNPDEYEDGTFQGSVDVMRLVFQAGDTDVPDDYRIEARLTYSDGGVELVPNADYESVVVKEALELPGP